MGPDSGATGQWDILNSGSNLSGYTGPVGITGNSGNGTDQISGLSVNGVFNVKAYGATGNGSTCDQTAIQNAINAAEAAHVGGSPVIAPVVYFPFGYYIVGCLTPDVPLTITGVGSPAIQGITLRGDGAWTSRIRSNSGVPVFFFEPANFYSTTLGGSGSNPPFSSVTFGGGSVTALDWGNGNGTSSDSRWINLKDSVVGIDTGPWFQTATMANGATSFDFQAFVQYPSSTLANGTTYEITDVSGNDGIGSDNPFNIHMIPGASTTTLSCSIAMSDGSHSVSAAIANASIAPATIHFIECNVDAVSNTMNFFLDGTKVNTSASVTSGATVVMTPRDQWTIGCNSAGPFGEDTDCFTYGNHWVGQIFGIRISSKAYNTSNYTAPTSLLASDGSNTQMLINGTRTSNVSDRAGNGGLH